MMKIWEFCDAKGERRETNIKDFLSKIGLIGWKSKKMETKNALNIDLRRWAVPATGQAIKSTKAIQAMAVGKNCMEHVLFETGD